MQAEELAKVFEAVKVLPLREQDIVVMKTRGSLSTETCRVLRDALAQQLPPGQKTLILDAGFDIEIIRKERYEDSLLLAFVKDLAKEGTRFDINPTMDYGGSKFDVASRFTEYVQHIDRSIRERAQELLRKLGRSQ